MGIQQIAVISISLIICMACLTNCGVIDNSASDSGKFN